MPVLVTDPDLLKKIALVETAGAAETDRPSKMEKIIHAEDGGRAGYNPSAFQIPQRVRALQGDTSPKPGVPHATMLPDEIYGVGGWNRYEIMETVHNGARVKEVVLLGSLSIGTSIEEARKVGFTIR